MSNILLNPRQQDCLDVIAEVYELAKEGKVDSVAIAACVSGGWATCFGGGRPGDLYMSLGDIQQQILTNVKTKITDVVPSKLIKVRQ